MLNSKTVLKKAGKKIIKPVAEEVEKIGETAKKQVLGEVGGQTSPVVEAMTQDGGEVSSEEERKRRKEAFRGLKRVREEAEKESQKTKEKEAARQQESQEVIQQPGEPITPTLGKPILPPSPWPKGRLIGPARKARKTEAPPGKD